MSSPPLKCPPGRGLPERDAANGVAAARDALAPRPWRRREADAAVAERLARQKHLDPAVAALLVARGHSEAEALEAHLRASPMDLHDPADLPGMEAATERLARALADRETILVHGDYDVDGVTGTTLLVRLLEHLGADVRWHIPNRLVDGYSFGDHSVRRAEETGAKVVISVDNGTSARETIAALRERGVDTVVTDHHEPPDGPLPPAVAIVNPKLEGSRYPWRELCGGAVAFKLAWGLSQRVAGRARVGAELKAFLEDATALVAVATVCDVVPLLGENRVFARFGLRALERTQSPGLRALLAVAKLAGRRLDAEDVGFQLGPRINASGRLGSADRAVQLLLSRRADEARSLAAELDALNAERKRIEREVLEEARVLAERCGDAREHPVLVLAGEGWHQGVVGIVAARLVEEFGRPAVVIGLDGELGRGSARTTDGFDVLAAMRGGADHMLRFGGHAQAAGCEVVPAAVDALRQAICARARDLLGGADLASPPLWFDGELPLATVTPELMTQIERCAPWGAGNEKPVFVARGVRLPEDARAVGEAGRHLLLRLRQGAAEFRAMAFRRGAEAPRLVKGSALDVAFTPRWNTFRGETRLELTVHDLV